jgi:hypothetical protein
MNHPLICACSQGEGGEVERKRGKEGYLGQFVGTRPQVGSIPARGPLRVRDVLRRDRADSRLY